MRLVIEHSVSVFDGFVKRLGGDMVKSFCIGLEKAYSENMVECPVAMTHVSKAGAIIVSWWSESNDEVESGPSTSNGRKGWEVKLLNIRMLEKVGWSVS